MATRIECPEDRAAHSRGHIVGATTPSSSTSSRSAQPLASIERRSQPAMSCGPGECKRIGPTDGPSAEPSTDLALDFAVLAKAAAGGGGFGVELRPGLRCSDRGRVDVELV
jgi:hypothetical protein